MNWCTPLNGVLGMIELVTEEPLSPRQIDYLQTARHSTEDLLTVINDILDYSHIDRGTLELENREFNLQQLITNCAASYRHVAEQQGLTLATKFVGNGRTTPGTWRRLQTATDPRRID